MVGYAGEVKLIDFGTARGHNRRCHTVAGVVFAKPGYVAPEVARQQVGDGRIDVYAIGVMLWELCAGKRLLSGDAQKHLEDVAAGRFEIPLLASSRGIPKRARRDHPEALRERSRRPLRERVAGGDRSRARPRAGARRQERRAQRACARRRPHEDALAARARAVARRVRASCSSRRASSARSPRRRPRAASMEIQAAHMTQDPAILAGTPYRMLRKIGEGASGEVFEAEHVELGRRYAVKVLTSAHAAAHDAVDRFRTRGARGRQALAPEPRAAARLRQVDRRPRLPRRWSSSRARRSTSTPRRGLGWREAVRLAIQATRALEAAHHAGVVHRDLKPQNLFLTTDGDLKLLDFGVAMALADTGDGERKQKGFAVFGTPEYMAPEQVAGETVDARCDIYALGCVLYELVTGTRPFEGSPSS